jgi:hypothetical protein
MPVACRCYRDHRHGDTQAGRPAGGLRLIRGPSRHRSPCPGRAKCPVTFCNPPADASTLQSRTGADSEGTRTHSPELMIPARAQAASSSRALAVGPEPQGLLGYLRLLVVWRPPQPGPDNKLAELTVRRLSRHGIIRWNLNSESGLNANTVPRSSHGPVRVALPRPAPAMWHRQPPPPMAEADS